MSYCRFCKEDRIYHGIKLVKSDVYVFEHVWGGIQCCGCKLSETPFGSATFFTYSEMIEHLNEHKRVGHAVPEHVIPSLEEQIKERGDTVPD